MTKFEPRDHGIVGTGRLGTSLALALSQAGFRVTKVAGRNAERVEAVARRVSGAEAASAAVVVASCDVVWLAVPDDALQALAEGLPWRRGQAAVHGSGALELAVLDAAARAGALRGCLHPLQSFPELAGAPERFSGIACGFEGDGPLGALLERVAQALGGSAFSLAGVDRARYHAAAVLASNHVVALHAAAARVWQLAGLPLELARPALAPLTRAVAEGLGQRPLEAVLTGPLARGDVATIERHLQALRETPELLQLYRQLCRELLTLPLALPEGRRAQLLSALEAEP